MTNEFVYILANTLAGGIGGYYTNDYAVKMIFRKYWGMGGVIIDTRPQFIANMSRLVERDVLNVHTLAPALDNTQSKLVMKDLLTDFWQNMQQETAINDLGEVPGIDGTFDRLLSFYKSYSQGALSEVLRVLIRDIKLRDVIKGEQCDFLAGSLYNLGMSEFDKSAIVSSALCDYQQKYAQRPITDFLPQEFFETLANNLAASLEDVPKMVKAAEIEEHLVAVIDKTYTELACDSLLDELELSIKDKSLFELLGYDNVAHISQECIDVLLDIVQSEQGGRLLDDLAASLFEELKQLPYSVYSLLNDGMRKKLDEYLRVTLPWFMERLLIWVEFNKPDLEVLLNRAVDKALTDDDDLLGLKNEAKRLLKDVFIGDVAAKYELVAKISDYVKNGTDPAKAAGELSTYIIWQLKKRKIGELLTRMEELGVIEPQDGGRILLNVLREYLPQLDRGRLEEIFARRAGEFVDTDLKTYFAHYFKQALKNHLCDQFICAPHSAEYIRLELKDKLCNLAGQNLGYFVDAESASILGVQLQQVAIDYLQANAMELRGHLADNIKEQLQERRLDWAINSDMQHKLKTYIAERSFDKLHSMLQEYKTKKLVEIYNLLSARMTAEQLSSFLGVMLTGNLDEFLKGKVEKAVAENLEGLSNEELQTLTESFMGTELQPLSRLGGGMGAAIGGAAAAVGLGSFSANPAINVAASSAMFAGIGWLTNVAAIQMIFRPYRAIKLLGVNMPFTPGIIPKQKPRFAAAMGEFIEQKLFVQERAVSDFLGKQQQARDSLLTLAHSNDYAWLTDLLQAQHGRLSRYTLDFVHDNLLNSREQVTAILQDEFSRLPIGVLEADWLNRALAARSATMFSYGEDFLRTKLRHLSKSSESLGEILPDGLKLALRRGVDNMLVAELNVLIEQLQDEQQFGEMLDRYSDNFESFIQQPIGRLLGVERSMQFKHAACRFALEKIQSERSCQTFYTWLNELLESELPADRSLGEVLDGALLNLVRASSGQILTSIVGRALNALSANREVIKQDFHRRFMDSSGILLKAANMILDIDETIYRTIDRLIDVELKEFAEHKEAELQSIIGEFVDNRLSGVRIGDLGLALNYRQILEASDQILRSTHTANALSSMLDTLLEEILNSNIKQIMRISNFRSLQNIYQRFWPEIRILRYQLGNNIHACHASLVRRAGDLVESIFMGNIYSLPMHRVLRGIKEEMLVNAGERLLSELQHGEIFNSNLDKYTKALEHELRFKSLDNLVDINLLSRDLLDCIAVSMEREQVRGLLIAGVHEFLGQLIKNTNAIIEDSTKKYFLQGVVSSFVAGMAKHFAALLKALDIRNVAVQQIDGMSAKSLKTMFDSFAAPYFRRIELYGLIAGLLGLITVPLIALLK